MENINRMCTDCACYGFDCDGTTNQVWTGCIYRRERPLLALILDSKSREGMTWDITAKKELSEDEREFIESFNPAIYHNDLECYFWAFDVKMPSGRWLENIRFENSLKTAKALIS